MGSDSSERICRIGPQKYEVVVLYQMLISYILIYYHLVNMILKTVQQIWQTIKASAHFGDSTNALLMEYPKVRDFCSYSSSTDDTPAGLIARAFAQGYFSVRKVLRYIAQSGRPKGKKVMILNYTL